MELKNTGNEISKFKINEKRKNASFYFNDVKYEITLTTMLKFNLDDGVKLDEDKLNEILHFDICEKNYQFCLKSLSQHIQTVKEMRVKLQKRNCESADIDDIISRLISEKYLNDEEYAHDYKDYYLSLGYGEKRIKRTLIQKGIDEEIVKNLCFSNEIELENAKKRLKLLEKQYENVNYELKKKKIYLALIRLGFNRDVIDETLKFMSEVDETKEEEKLKRDYLKAKKKYKESSKVKSKVIRYLVSRGYQFSKINEVIKEDDIDAIFK